MGFLHKIGLSVDINKDKPKEGIETQEGVVSDKLPQLELSMSNEDLIELSNKWEKSWMDSSKRNNWIKQIEENEKYWLGKQFSTIDGESSRPLVDNLIFESLETYLPQVTRRNPEPLVMIKAIDKGTDPIPAHELFIEKTKDRLSDIADEIKLRLKLKKVARHWGIYQLGVGKYGWDIDRDIPTMKVLRPKLLILDPDAVIDEDGYSGERIGEYKKMRAGALLAIIKEMGASPKAVGLINEIIEKKNKATEIKFIEWWTPKYMFWKLGSEVLLKRRNPHWNYDEMKTDVETDEFGVESPVENEIIGINHFSVPKLPFTFLSVFNLGDRPMDATGLIQQNLANQDLLNKRNKQIGKNVDKMNGGAIISQEKSGLSKSQANQVSDAIRRGGSVVIPSGSAQDAIHFPSTPSLPGDVYSQLIDTRARLRDIFGTSGSTPAGVKQENTVRGKILSRGLDTDRIGGGVSEYLEQFADDAYNWFIQLLYVYDPEFRFIEGAQPPRLLVSVKEGSLLPKDSISIANQALELASLNRIANIDLYKRLDYPNAEELAANVWLEQNAPHILYKENLQVQEALQMQAQQAQEMAMQSGQLSVDGVIENEAGVPGGSALSEVPENVVQ